MLAELSYVAAACLAMTPGTRATVVSTPVSPSGAETPVATVPATGEPADDRVLPGPDDLSTPEGAGRWMTYAYLLAKPEQARVVLSTFEREGILEDRFQQGNFGIHLSLLAARHKDMLPRLEKWAPDRSGGVVRTVALAVWWAGGDERVARLEKLRDKLPKDSADRDGITALIKQPPPEIAKIPRSPEVLDLWWSAFFASGETKYVDLIIDGLPPRGTTLDDLEAIPQILVARSASWSLSSNAFQHPRVLERLRERRENDGPWEALDGCIAEAEEQLAESECPAPKSEQGESQLRRQPPKP